MKVTVYIRPNGRRETIDVAVNAEAEAYITTNNIEVSMEETSPGIAAVYGKYSQDPKEPEALIIASIAKGSEAAIDKLVEQIKALKQENRGQ